MYVQQRQEEVVFAGLRFVYEMNAVYVVVRIILEEEKTRGCVDTKLDVEFILHFYVFWSSLRGFCLRFGAKLSGVRRSISCITTLYPYLRRSECEWW